MSDNSRQGGHHHNNRDNNNSNRRRNNQGSSSSSSSKHDGPKREAILDLNQYKDQQIRVKFIGGRQITGSLKGFDQLMNLVLEEVTETLRDPEDDTVLTDKTRELGFVVVRCTSILTISPVDGSEIIENPFITQEQ